MFWTLAGNLLCNLMGLFQLKYFSSWILASLNCGRLPIETAVSLPRTPPRLHLLLESLRSQARIIIRLLLGLQSQFTLALGNLFRKGNSEQRVPKLWSIILKEMDVYCNFPISLTQAHFFFSHTEGSRLEYKCLRMTLLYVKFELTFSFKI